MDVGNYYLFIYFFVVYWTVSVHLQSEVVSAFIGESWKNSTLMIWQQDKKKVNIFTPDTTLWKCILVRFVY